MCFVLGKIDVGDKSPFAGHKAAVLAHPPVGGNVAVAGLAHLRNSEGRLAPRMRSAASAMASTIWA